MKEQQIIDAIIDALQLKGIIINSQRIQDGKAVQIKTNDGDYFNICMKKLDKNTGCIIKKLH